MQGDYPRFNATYRRAKKLERAYSPGDYKSLSSLAVHIQESFIEIWMGSKSRLLKALIGVCKLTEVRFSSIIEHPQRPNHSYTVLSCRLATFWFVDNEGICLQLCRQANRFAFARVPKGLATVRTSSHSGREATHSLTLAGVPASCNSPNTACGMMMRVYSWYSTVI